MPIFFQHAVNATTRLGIWKIEEPEGFFKNNVPQHRDVTHPHKRLQHLAGRFLLQYLFPDFPYGLIEIADTRKPFLPGDQYHFSISHCGDYAAAIVSKDQRVGIDIEIPVDKIVRVKNKFLGEGEELAVGSRQSAVGSPAVWQSGITGVDSLHLLTLLWSSKEAIFKWFGNGSVDFREDIHLLSHNEKERTIESLFSKTNTKLSVQYRLFDHLVLAWTIS